MRRPVREPLLEIEKLSTHFETADGLVKAVDDVTLRVDPGRTLCIVGESGCGKSVTARSILRLVDPPGQIVAGSIRFRSGGEVVDLAALDSRGPELRRIRGKEIGMVFQEPMVALSPVHTIGQQLVEVLRLHEQLGKKEARERAIAELRGVGIPQPERRIDAYSFQLSGGMRQRAMIAMALACRPQLLIADEPTTALDVTTQAQILRLLRTLQDERGMAILFITHDLGVVAELADRVAVMYLGNVVEECDVDSLFHDPRHPYTRALLRSVPRIERRARRRLPTIRGQVPHPQQRPSGCPYRTRCDHVVPGECDVENPDLVGDGLREVRCVHYPTADSIRAGHDLLPVEVVADAG
ncbi:oligopeptide/dipeptide ABC transporter ATP-binding protein [Kribbella aluminosa]|uniref:Oligopeptide/dipeptide ABC transporter ATP-binding protein n=1 Tax=Kribbella aluminosa TaxID=416017 RepID=A0ABS4UYI5_9ACTN|nr:ABC transporter ATP-binding protein [Kribbella aluminosa]MBP2356689.1 oligopeptide/dipeptide ABC transporter ATP-binding protein [Kribbella aluminosa]